MCGGRQAFAPEALAQLAHTSQHAFFVSLRTRWWYSHLGALLGALNIGGLMGANMVGFATATGGTSRIVHNLLSAHGVALLAVSWLMLYDGVVVMFEIRAAELLIRGRDTKKGKIS